MNDHIDDPFAVLRRLAGDPQPPSDTEKRALAQLQDAIARETRPPRRVRWGAVAAATIAVAAIAAVAVAFLAPVPSAATLDEVARAARQAAPLEVPTGSFIYQHTESVDLVVRPGSDFGLDVETVAYLLPSRRETWRQSESGFVRTATTVGEPTFFDAATQAAYEQGNGPSMDQVGETIVEQFTNVVDPIADTDWPTDPKALRAAMEQALARGADDRSLDVQLFDLALDILHTATDPQLKATLIEVIADLDLDQVAAGPEGVALAITDPSPPPTRLTATISKDGTLTAASVIWLQPAFGIPADTTIATALHQPPVVVEQLPDR